MPSIPSILPISFYGGEKRRKAPLKREIKLINQGAYGCIFRPGFNCNNGITGKNYLTKIQKYTGSIENEFKISQYIRKIKGYTKYYAPIIKQCNVNISAKNVSAVKQCDIFKENTEPEIMRTTYISNKIRYIGKHDLADYLLYNVESNHFLMELMQTYKYILKSTQLLGDNGIVHFDLKSNNIMVDEKTDSPILIDFGLSFLLSDVTIPSASSVFSPDYANKLSSIFFAFDTYNYWPIDTIMCSYIFKYLDTAERNKPVSETDLSFIYNVFSRGKSVYINSTNTSSSSSSETQRHNNVLTSKLIDQSISTGFYAKYMEHFSQFIGKSWGDVYMYLIPTMKTWDNYAIAVIYLFMLEDFYDTNVEQYKALYNKNQDKMHKLIQLLQTILFAMPGERPSPEITSKLLVKIFKG